MNKIIEVALSNKFGTDATVNLMEVIGATPNPEMAAEILLGVYEQPKLESIVMDSRGCIKTATSVDYWNSNVKYSYTEEVAKHIYVDRECDTTLITPENYKDYAVDYEHDNSKSFQFSTGEFKERKGSCRIGEWLDYTAHDM
jgi:hypothetical protein